MQSGVVINPKGKKERRCGEGLLRATLNARQRIWSALLLEKGPGSEQASNCVLSRRLSLYELHWEEAGVGAGAG